jgi:peptidoglycan/LPS O-acetylase OafA/YrhL
MHYRREIDGLRAVAVVPVILFHADFALFAGGYVGVDVFFVISGYLITSILINELEAGRFSLARFYERRARRILPALFFMMICCIPFAWFWMLPSQFKDFSQALIAVSLFVSNILFWQKTDYFAPEIEESPLMHTWSLAVEEQFYIFFPLLLWLLWRYDRMHVVSIILLLCVVSLGVAEWGWRNAPTANFFLIVTRAWELGAGALCAFMLQSRPLRENTILSTLGIGLIMLSVFTYDDLTPFPSLYALAPVGGTALIILFAGGLTPVGRLLSIPAFVGIGLISYSAYLWHQPLFAFARMHGAGLAADWLLLTLAGTSLGLGWLSWRYIERPFRKRDGVLVNRSAAFALSATGVAAFISFGLYGISSDRQDLAWRAANAGHAQVYDLLETAIDKKYPVSDVEPCRFRSRTLSEKVLARLDDCHARHGSGLALVGDSHGTDLYLGYTQIWDGPFLFGLVGAGCTPEKQICDVEDLGDLVERRPDLFSEIHYTQAGFAFLETKRKQQGRGIFEDQPITILLDPEDYQLIQEPLKILADYLSDLNETVLVTWVGPRFEPMISKHMMIRRGCLHNYALRPGQREIYEKLDRELAATAAEHGFDYVSQIDGMEFALSRDFMTCDTIYWIDGDHWSLEGAERFVNRLVKSGALILPTANPPKQTIHE